jgi:hypothetical protein
MPPHLRIAIEMTIHKKTLTKTSLFGKLQNRRLLTFISTRFKPLFCPAGIHLYNRGDPICGLHVISSGKAAMVRPRYSSAIYGVIDPSRANTYNLSHVGLEDTVVNHLFLLRDLTTYDFDDFDLDRRMNNGQLSKRYFCCLAIAHIEGLTLSMQTIDMIKRDFETSACKLIKWQV